MSALKVIFAAVAVCTLTSCSRGIMGERVWGQEGSMAWFASASDETKLAYFTSRCQSYGFVWGTPWMAQCIAEETRSAKSSARRNMAAGLAAQQSMSRPTSCNMFSGTITCY